MRKPSIGPFSAITRFTIEELDDGRGLKLVLLTLEATDKAGRVKQIEATIPPKDAAKLGGNLVEIGTALSSTRH